MKLLTRDQLDSFVADGEIIQNGVKQNCEGIKYDLEPARGPVSSIVLLKNQTKTP